MKKSKLSEHAHEDEARRLRGEGHGWIEISNILNRKYPDDGGYSHMAIKRGLQSYEKSLVEQMIDDGGNPIVDMDMKFQKALAKNIKKIDDLMKGINEMVSVAKDNGSVNDMAKAYTVALKGWEQERRSWESLHNSTFGQMKNIGEVNIKKDQDIKILLVNWTDQLIKLRKDLCLECKKKADEILNNLF